jgi:branched-chain amino acid transport system ATP-binding protein
MSILEVRNLRVLYQHSPAVDGVSFTVDEGSITGILGANGAGKSTVMNALSGIILHMKKTEEMTGGEEITVQGDIIYRGEDISNMKPAKRAGKGIILCPERRHIFPESSVLENLKIGGYLASRAEARETLEYVFTLFPDLKKLQKRQGGFLSGGEQQMLAIGRALMAQPQLLLLDEPFLGLSPMLESRLAKAITDINREQGVTILIAEQYARPLLPLIGYGYIMECGAISMQGTASQLANDAAINKAYFGTE